MDVLYREHDHLFLILRLQHPWLKWCCLLLCTNCQSHWMLCCLMWEGSYWLVTYVWPCAWSPVTRESPAPQTAAHTPLSKHVLFLVSILFQPWVAAPLPCMTNHHHQCSVLLDSWVSSLGGPQTGLLNLAPRSSPVKAILGIARLLLTYFWQISGEQSHACCRLSPNMFPSSRHRSYLSGLIPVPTISCIFAWKLGLLV